MLIILCIILLRISYNSTALYRSQVPQMARLPESQVPSHPLIHNIRDITETFQETFTKPVILTSCQLCSYNVSYNTSLPLEQVWCGYNQPPEKYSAIIGISRNTKCAIWNGFPKSSHIL